MATNLYRILGKKTVSEKKVFKNKLTNSEIKENIFSDEVIEYSQKKILELDKNFDFHVFIQGAQKAFKLIVEAFYNKKIDEVKHLISDDVYGNFQKAVNIEKNEKKSFNIIFVNASILKINVIENTANIKVKFLSKQREKLNNTIKDSENIEDVWTFERDMNANSPVWKLVEVGID